MLEQLNQLQDNLEANQYLMEENSKTFQEKLQDQKEKEELENDHCEEDTTKNGPHMINLNEDPLLNGKIVYAL